MGEASVEPRLEEAGGRGRFVFDLEDGLEAEMTWRAGPGGAMVIDHTFVPPQARNRGLAEKLVAAGARHAQVTGRKVIPACSYAALQFRRHPEWRDLLAT